MCLFSMLGLLPGGVDEKDLTYLMGNENWRFHSIMLQKKSLLIERIDPILRNMMNKEIRKYSLLPFMNKYAESLLSHACMKSKHMKILDFFTELCG